MSKKNIVSQTRQLRFRNRGQVSVSILVEGTMLSNEIEIQSIETFQSVNQIPIASIQLSDPFFKWSESFHFSPGNTVEIKIGYGGDETEVFKGVLISQTSSASKAENQMTLQLRDFTFRMDATQRTSVFQEMSNSEVISELIGRYPSLSLDQVDQSQPNETFIQSNCSDWKFLIKMAKSVNSFVWVNCGRISIKPYDLDGLANIGVNRDQVKNYELSLDSLNQYEKAKGKVWDYTKQEVLESIVGSAGGQSSDLAKAIKLPDLEYQKEKYSSFSQMEAGLNSKMSEASLSAIHGKLVIPGNTFIQLGDILELSGFGARLSGKAIVSGLSHSVSGEKWFLRLDLGILSEERAEDQVISPAGLHIGVVDSLEGDPSGQHRVRLKIPLIDAEMDGVWARFSSPDAGNLRGFHFRPEIGDEVVVSFMDGDIQNPVILGSLHSGVNPSPIPDSDDNFKKGIITKRNLQLIFDDAEETILIQTPSGNKVIISNDNNVSIEDSLGNKVEMNKEGINIESVKDLNLNASGDVNVNGVNIQLESQATLKLNGQSGAELTSGASTQVKGAIVQIN